MKKSFNVVIATAGRDTLQRMINSIVPQLEDQDFITILWDCKPFKLNFGHIHKTHILQCWNNPPLGFWGHGSRTRWQDELMGDYIMNGDDDDIYAPDAMEIIRRNVTDEKVYFFRYNYHGVLVPRNHVVEIGNVGTPTGVYPNKPPFPDWEFEYCGDGKFYQKLVQKFPHQFIDEVIYIVKPKEDPVNTEVPIHTCTCGSVSHVTHNKMTGSFEAYCNRCGKIERI